MLDVLVLGREIEDLMRPVGRFAGQRGRAESSRKRQVLAHEVGEQREEDVVKRLEPAGELDGLAEWDIALDLEVLGGNLPGVLPVGPEPVGLLCGQPANLLLTADRVSG